VEAVIKLVPFCTGGSNTVGVYAAGLTDVGVTLTVTDTQTGLVKTCTNALGHPFDLIRDGPFVCDGGEGQEITVTLPGGVPLAMVRIPAGTFQMGSAQTERGHWDNEAQHTVALTQDFYVGKTELTQGQWQAVMGAAMSTACGSYGMGASYPVYCVTYDEIGEAAGFVEKLNAHLTSTGQPGAGRYRLPTEAEWERAARGGVTTSRRFSFGDATNGDDSCGANAEANSYVWWCYAAGNASHPVGTKAPNPYGLYDMHGNLSEWVSDWYEAQTNAAQTNPAGPPTGTYRVIRDGPWAYNLVNCRSARRSYYFPSTPHWSIGFRLARSL
jgi:formylglycine-generating enzyme required for sulfatase activity